MSEAADLRTARHILLGLAAGLLDLPAAALTQRAQPHSMNVVATHGAAAEQITRIAYELREGACWQVHATATPVLCPDLNREQRWPAYRRAVLELPVRSIAGFPLRFADQLLGALLLYDEQPGHFTADRVSDALLLADHASLAIAHVNARAKIANLEVALRTNREIAIAIGIIMDRAHLNETQAFGLLQELSQTRHAKLRDIAADIGLSGEIPGLARPDARCRPREPVIDRRRMPHPAGGTR